MIEFEGEYERDVWQKFARAALGHVAADVAADEADKLLEHWRKRYAPLVEKREAMQKKWSAGIDRAGLTDV